MEILHSSFLMKIENIAKQLAGKSNAALTYERLFAAVVKCLFIDTDSLKNESDETKNEILASEFILKKAAGAEADWQKIYAALISYIEKNDNDFANRIQTQMAMMNIDKAAQAKEIDKVTCDLVLCALLTTPSDMIKGIFVHKIDKAQLDNIYDELNNQKKTEENLNCTFKPIDLEDESSELIEFESTEKSFDKIKDDIKRNRKKAILDLSEKVKCIQELLLDSVYGQDNAVSVFSSGYFQAELLDLTDKKRFRPKATYLFAGPPGVGKTFLAEKAAEALGLPFMRCDMSEYADKEANIEFCGSDKVYKNGKAGNVTGFVEKNPKCVLLFDEIEKAHTCVIHLFLSLLDAGRLRDNFTDNEVSFKDAIIIFTTNAGKQLYNDSDTGDYSGLSRKVILNALSKDVNSETGVPYFPAAICSRFASGNVVMFNHMEAHDLRSIAKREILRHAENFEREVGIDVYIDDEVFTAILLSEGGNVDARTIRARAESFFNNELYELFRLISSGATKEKISNINEIFINVTLPIDDTEIKSLFKSLEEPKALVFASEETANMCSTKAKGCIVLSSQSNEEAIEIIKDNDIKVILIDPTYGKYDSTLNYLNLEDVESKSRDMFWTVREQFASIPIYMLLSDNATLNDEEKLSFTRSGVRGFLTISDDTEDSFAKDLSDICEKLHQQDSVRTLTKMNKAISFETGQLISEQCQKAEIRLFDFKLNTCIDAEDGKNILSNISKPNVKFKQVLGAADAKKELQYFVEYLKNPKKYLGTGVSVPRGILLYGPPGTGKTMLAKAMASESDVAFIAAEGNQFLKRYVGEGQEAVHELFMTARKYAPAILFIDEIDAIAKERQGSDNGAEATLTAFLTEMDGFKNDPSRPVFVLAATNFDIEPGQAKSLDPALMRRFDRRVYIDLPAKDDRIKYLRMKMEQNHALRLSQDQISNISMRSTGMSLAELESVVELALRSAIRANSDIVTDEIFEEAFETFNSGDTKKWDKSQLERVARHETGHAFLCWHSGETPSYLTIVARGNHGGYMQHADNEGKAVYTKDELLAKIRTSLGGRAAEIVYYGDKDGISTGASGDLNSATNLAQQLVCTYGMDEEFGFAVVDSQAYRNGELSPEVRTAVNKILSAEMKNAIKIISENKNRIDNMVDVLMEKNHLNGKEIDDVFSGGDKIRVSDKKDE